MYDKGYDGFVNYGYVSVLEDMSKEDQLNYIKGMWKQDSKTYNEWKEWCVESGFLHSLFGTKDHPILIDESKL